MPVCNQGVIRHRLPAFGHVVFEQHPPENCILHCSKCVFFVASGNI